MAALYAAASSSSQKEMEVFPTGKHNDTWREGGLAYVNKIRSFLAKHAAPGAAAMNSGSTQRAAL